MPKPRTYRLKRNAEKRRKQLQAQYPERKFRVGCEPNGFNFCVYLVVDWQPSDLPCA